MGDVGKHSHVVVMSCTGCSFRAGAGLHIVKKARQALDWHILLS